MMSSDSVACRSKDWSRQYTGLLLWWGLPLLMGISAGFFRLSLQGTALVWAAAFAWMGTGCVLNARRCGRLHCFFSGPALWLGAIGALLVGFEVLSSAHALQYVIWGTAGLVALSYLPEAIWGKYARRS